MGKKIILLTLIFYGNIAIAQKDIYESARFDELTAGHETLAIMPFIAQLDLEKKTPMQELKGLAEREGYAVQEALEGYFSRRKKRKKFNVEFQDTKETNRILGENSINYTNLDVYTSKQLAEILGVDGIISGNLDLNILLSKGVPTDFSILDYFNGEADYGRIGIKISDGKTGKLLWRYENDITKKTGKDTNELIDKMMKRASRKFPYDREKKRKKKRNN